MTMEIFFPITELSDDLFESEKVFHVDYEWDGIYYIKEKDLKMQDKRVFIDSGGYLLKITGREILETSGKLFSFLTPATLTVKFGIERTGERLSIDDLRNVFLLRKQGLFHITHNKLMTIQEYEKRINNATTYKELIEIAGFEQDDL